MNFGWRKRGREGGALHSIGDAPPSLAARPTDDQPIILSQLPLFSDSIFVQNSFESSAYSHKTRQQRETESKFSNVPIVSHDVSTAFHIAIIFVFAFLPNFSARCNSLTETLSLSFPHRRLVATRLRVPAFDLRNLSLVAVVLSPARARARARHRPRPSVAISLVNLGRRENARIKPDAPRLIPCSLRCSPSSTPSAPAPARSTFYMQRKRVH